MCVGCLWLSGLVVCIFVDLVFLSWWAESEFMEDF